MRTAQKGKYMKYKGTSHQETSPRLPEPDKDEVIILTEQDIDYVSKAMVSARSMLYQIREKYGYTNQQLLDRLNSDVFRKIPDISRQVSFDNKKTRPFNVKQLFDLHRAFPDDFDLNAIADGTPPRGLHDLTNVELINRQEQITAELLRRLSAK